jgi:hypothetical protein
MVLMPTFTLTQRHLWSKVAGVKVYIPLLQYSKMSFLVQIKFITED